MEAIKEVNVEEVVTETQETVEETVEGAVKGAVEEVIERPYTLRKLKDSDLMPVLRLFRKLGLKDFKDVFIRATDSEDAEEVGKLVAIDIADMVIEKISGGFGEEIYSFWSELSGIPVEEIKEMEFGTLPLMIYDSFNEVKNTAFFKVLFKLL